LVHNCILSKATIGLARLDFWVSHEASFKSNTRLLTF